MKRYILGSTIALGLAVGFTACDDDNDLDPTSIFQIEEVPVDPTSPTYKFDKWLEENYLNRYNMTFTYRMKSLATDPDYNLVPANIDKSKELAVLTKYLWYEAYDEVTGSIDFLRQYGPKMIHVIGSSAVNPTAGTEILGLAEGGLKVSLFVVNDLDPTDFRQLNARYFKTMHHEFSHILHQTKTYPKSFEEFNAANYEPNTWQDRIGGTTCSLGFTSPYASSQAREDFAETCANYITRTDDEWALTLWLADRGWYEIDDTYITYRLSGFYSWAANYDALMDRYGFCYYYYRSADDEAKGHKTYVGQFVEKSQIYYLTDMEVTADPDGSATYTYTQDGQRYFSFYYMNGGTRKFYDPDEFEAYLKATYTDKGITLYPAAASVLASEGGDGRDGKAIIEEKVSIVRQWFETAWGIDLDQLRAVVQRRQADIDIDALLQQIEDVE